VSVGNSKVGNEAESQLLRLPRRYRPSYHHTVRNRNSGEENLRTTRSGLSARVQALAGSRIAVVNCGITGGRGIAPGDPDSLGTSATENKSLRAPMAGHFTALAPHRP